MRYALLLMIAIGWVTPLHAQSDTSTRARAAAAEVRAAEASFAASMATRDFDAFQQWVADDAVFFGGGQVTRGKQAVLAAWKPFFDTPAAPFSWAPDSVEVLSSGGLALSFGPVLDPQGNRVATFNSVWRREADGRWRVVFDKGANACRCESGKLDQ